MKKLLMIAGALLFCAWNAHSEVVETVGYNPTRYGQYKRLKISSGVEFPSGIVTPLAESGGGLTLEACQDGCTNPAYKMDRLQAGIVEGNNTDFDVQTLYANKGSIILKDGGEISSAIGAGNVLAGQLEATDSNLVVNSRLTLGKGVITPPAGRTDCQWQWENVAHKDGTAKVLALKDCAGGTDTNPEEPAATCAQQDYLVAHKAECCPSEDYSNEDCWTPKTGKWTYNSENLVTGVNTTYEVNGRTRVECTAPYIHRASCPVDDIGAYTTLFHRYGSWDHHRGEYPDCTEFNSTCTVKVYCWDGVPSTRMDITYVCDSWYEKNGW